VATEPDDCMVRVKGCDIHYLRWGDPESEEGERGRMFRNPKSYADLDTAVRHFHLQPPQPCEQTSSSTTSRGGRCARSTAAGAGEAHHHVLLDQPLALVAALRTILADWQHSIPRRRPG
jgi:hypothetical protein